MEKKQHAQNPGVIEYFLDGDKVGAINLADRSWWSKATGAKRQFARSFEHAEAALLAGYDHA